MIDCLCRVIRTKIHITKYRSRIEEGGDFLFRDIVLLQYYFLVSPNEGEIDNFQCAISGRIFFFYYFCCNVESLRLGTHSICCQLCFTPSNETYFYAAGPHGTLATTLLVLITDEMESCDFEPSDGATLEPQTNIGIIIKGSPNFLQ